MDAGRELDMLVAERVMGWKPSVRAHPEMPVVTLKDLYEDANSPMPQYSTDITAAWLVVERLKLLQMWGHLTITFNHTFGRWIVGWPWADMGANSAEFESISESAPHAICLAALKAVS